MTDESHRRAAAREKARLNRRRQRRRASGGRWAFRGGVAVVVVAAVVAVVLVLRGGSSSTTGPHPENMAGDGITLGKGLVADRTPGSPAAPPSTASASPTAASPTAAAPTSTATSSAATVRIAIYVDYQSPVSASFSKADGEYIRGLVRSGAATVTFHPLALLSAQSQGTRYSERAAATAACVATYSPDAYFDFDRRMLERRPAVDTAGPTNAELVALVKGVAGIQRTSDLSRCITEQDYATWAVDATRRAQAGPIAGSALASVSTVPTVLVDGHRYRYSTPFTIAEFSNFVVTTAGNSYSDSATATPTPTATGSPVPGRAKVGTPAPK